MYFPRAVFTVKIIEYELLKFLTVFLTYLIQTVPYMCGVENRESTIPFRTKFVSTVAISAIVSKTLKVCIMSPEETVLAMNRYSE